MSELSPLLKSLWTNTQNIEILVIYYRKTFGRKQHVCRQFLMYVCSVSEADSEENLQAFPQIRFCWLLLLACFEPLNPYVIYFALSF